MIDPMMNNKINNIDLVKQKERRREEQQDRTYRSFERIDEEKKNKIKLIDLVK